MREKWKSVADWRLLMLPARSTHEEERHSARIAALEGAQAVADGLESPRRTGGQADRYRSAGLPPPTGTAIGQDQCAGGEADAGEAARLRMDKRRFGRQTVNRL